MATLHERIDDLPDRYAPHKAVLRAITTEHQCRTKTQLRRHCKDYLADYTDSLSEVPTNCARLRDQLTRCKKLMHACLHKAIPRL